MQCSRGVQTAWGYPQKRGLDASLHIASLVNPPGHALLHIGTHTCGNTSSHSSSSCLPWRKCWRRTRLSGRVANPGSTPRYAFLPHLPRSYSTDFQHYNTCGSVGIGLLLACAAVLPCWNLAGSSPRSSHLPGLMQEISRRRVLGRVYLYGRTPSYNCRASPDGASAVALPEIPVSWSSVTGPQKQVRIADAPQKAISWHDYDATKNFPSLFFLRQSYATLLRGCDHDSSCPVCLLVCQRSALLLWCPPFTYTNFASKPAGAYRDHWLPTTQTLDLYLSGDVGLCTLRIHRSMESRSPGSNTIPSTYI